MPAWILFKKEKAKNPTLKAFVEPKSQSLNLHQLHDQSCLLLRTYGPPSSGLCLSSSAILLLKVLEISIGKFIFFQEM